MRTSRAPLLQLTAFSMVCFLGKAYETLLRGIDSNIHAIVSLAVTSQGFLPVLPMTGPERTIFNDHPFFYFWLNGWVMRLGEALGGPLGWSSRLLTSGFATGCVLLTYLLGRILGGELFGFLAALFYLLERDTILMGATLSLDPPMLFFILLSFVLWAQDRWKWAGVACGVGLWMKTPVVLLLYPTSFAYLVLCRKSLKHWFYSFGIAALIGSFIWILTWVLGGRELVSDYWGRQVFGTAVLGRHQGYGPDFWMFFRMIRNGFLPGLPFLFLGLVYLRSALKHTWAKISLLSLASLFLFITPMRFKMDYYFQPAFPFLALLSAYPLASFFKHQEKKIYLGFSQVSTVIMAFALTTPLSFGPEAFEALKRFIPILKETPITEPVVLISGGEPRGSSHDYALVIELNTNKSEIVTTDCQTFRSLSVPKDHWVVLSRENLRCLSEEGLLKYPTQVRHENQFLLGTRTLSSEVSFH